MSYLRFSVALLVAAGCSSSSAAPVSPASDASAALDASALEAGRDAASSSSLDAGFPDAKATPDASPDAAVACGCNGMAGCAVWQDVYVTWYGYNDNSCGTEAQMGCNDIANPGLGPKMHNAATAGAGTYDDPSTAAASNTTDPGHAYESSGGVTLAPGTLIYNPEVQQYFIMEDSCLECGDEYACALSPNDTDGTPPPAGCVVGANLHIDFWMGPNDMTQSASLQTCEDNATLGAPYAGIGAVVINPPPNLPVKPNLLYSNGTCFASSQVAVAGCP